MTVLDLRRRGGKISRNERAAQQRFQKGFHLRLGRNHTHRVNNLPRRQNFRRVIFIRWRHFTGEGQLFFVLIPLNRQCRDARATRLVGREFRQNLLRTRRLFGENQLQIMAEGILHGGDKLIRHAYAIRQRTDDGT